MVWASSQYPPRTLPLICTKLQKCYKVFTSLHVHSTMTARLPCQLQDYLPSPNCDARSKADVCVTLIWKNVGRDAELLISPTKTSVIKGESNLLRYFSRRFALFNYTSSSVSEIVQANNDDLLDAIHLEYAWGRGNASKLATSVLEPVLKNSNFLFFYHSKCSTLVIFSQI